MAAVPNSWVPFGSRFTNVFATQGDNEAEVDWVSSTTLRIKYYLSDPRYQLKREDHFDGIAIEYLMWERVRGLSC